MTTKLKIDGDTVTFSTRREVDVNCGIIGLAPYDGTEEGWQVYEGYDGIFGGFWPTDLTNAERVELADYMINLWAEFKERYEEEDQL